MIQRAELGTFTAPPRLSAPPNTDPATTPDERETRLRDLPDGYLFETITKGRNTMPAYAMQIPVEDRWNIVHYLRALQTRFE